MRTVWLLSLQREILTDWRRDEFGFIVQREGVVESREMLARATPGTGQRSRPSASHSNLWVVPLRREKGRRRTGDIIFYRRRLSSSQHFPMGTKLVTMIIVEFSLTTNRLQKINCSLKMYELKRRIIFLLINEEAIPKNPVDIDEVKNRITH